MMSLKDIALDQQLPPLSWCVPDLLLNGYINTIASLPGEGKTALLTGLAWQLSRPNGKFLGRALKQTSTLYVDFDAPGEGRSLRYWLDKHKRAYPDGNMSRITLLEPDQDTYGLGETDILHLMDVAREHGAGLILIDSFGSAFPTVDPVKLVQVQGPLWHLRRLATETNAAVVLLDHLPKPVSGERAGARGIIGSVAKSAQARAVHILSRVLVDCRNVLRWDTTKMSYSARPAPFGVELRFECDAVFLEAIPLPKGHGETRTERAVRAMQDYLEARRGEVIPHKVLLDVATVEGGLRKRAAADALSLLKTHYGRTLITSILPGRGKPQGYLLKPENDELGEPPAILHQLREKPSLTPNQSLQPSMPKSSQAASKEVKG